MFDEKAQEIFFNSTYTFKGEGDRMGYHLAVEKVVPNATGILSEPICYGAVQVPSHGEPIVLLKERQTIGGYPKIGSVIAVDCFKLAQLKAGGKVRFKEVSLEEAQRATKAFYTFLKSKKRKASCLLGSEISKNVIEFFGEVTKVFGCTTYFFHTACVANL